MTISSGREAGAVGQLVDALGGVLQEDDRVGGRVGADEPPDHIMRGIEDLGGKHRLEARSAVDAGIPGKEVLDAAEHAPERRRAGGIVQEDVRALGPIEQRHRRIDADDVRAEVGKRQRCGVVNASEHGSCFCYGMGPSPAPLRG